MRELTSDERKLWENHLSFLRSHRGTVSKADDSFLLHSDRPEFTYVVLGKAPSVREVLKGFPRVYLAPWSGEWEAELDAQGYIPLAGLSHMRLGRRFGKWRASAALEVRTVDSESALEEFTEVQARGFTESDDEYRAWYPWLSAANRRNLPNSAEQTFYVGYLGGKAVGITLLLFTKDVAGIYGVATLPEYRKRGVSAALLVRAVARALETRHEIVTLQAFTDSYAQRFYERLGFEEVFRMEALARGR